MAIRAKVPALAAIFAIALGGLVTACGGDSTPEAKMVDLSDHGALVSAAQKEASLSLYTSTDNATFTAVNDAFTKKYGIKVTAAKLESAALTQRITREAASGVHKWDVTIHSLQADLATMDKQGLLADISGLPSFAAWPEESRSGNYAATTSYNPYLILYNKDTVSESEVPKTFADMLAPRFKGRICGPDPEVSANYSWSYHVWKVGSGDDDFLTKLGKNGFVVVPSLGDCAQKIAAGEVDLGETGLSYVKTLTDQGAHVGFWMPPRFMAVVRDVAVSANASSPNAAALYVDFLLSKEGQEVISGQFGISSPIDGIQGTVAIPEGALMQTDAEVGAKESAANASSLRGRS